MPSSLRKGTVVTQMVATNEVPETVVVDGTVGALQTRRWAKEGHAELTVEGRRKSCLKSWSSQVLSPGQRKTRRRF